VHDLAVIVVSHDQARWLPACLSSLLAGSGDLALDVVVVDNSGAGDSAALVERDFPAVRALRTANHGFGHANNRGLETCDARHVLFLNPDTELRDGILADLVAALNARPGVGAAGARQVTPAGAVHPSIRRFPSARRALAEALGSERIPGARALGERVLDPAAYERETPCDWTTGAALAVRGEVLEAVGAFDERFFLFSEETDLCRRIRAAGWEVVHLPSPTFVHHVHAGRGGLSPALALHDVRSRRLYAQKHLSPVHRALYLAAVVLRHGLRALVGRERPSDVARIARAAAGRA
jgi:GT2 family glycosyltransferase